MDTEEKDYSDYKKNYFIELAMNSNSINALIRRFENGNLKETIRDNILRYLLILFFLNFAQKDIFTFRSFRNILNKIYSGNAIETKNFSIPQTFLKKGLRILSDAGLIIYDTKKKNHKISISSGGISFCEFDIKCISESNIKISISQDKNKKDEMSNENVWLKYLNKILLELKEDESLKYYVNQKGKDENENSLIELNKIIDDFLIDDKNVLIILGNRGSGKTTFSRKIFLEKANQYLNDPINNRIPILLYLKEYLKASSIENLIRNYLKNFGIKYKNFKKHIEEKKIILILDGFDEMSNDMRRNISFQNFLEINKLLSKEIKLILTSRTHYFKDKKDEENILCPNIPYITTGFQLSKKNNYKIYYLQEFKLEDIKQFLKNIFNEKWHYYYERMKNEIYDWENLARCPLYLSLIVEILSQYNKIDNVTEDKLFELYVNLWFDREIRNKKRDIDRDDMIFLLEELATIMYNTGKDIIHHTQLEKNISIFIKEESLSLDDLRNICGKIRTSTFLIREQNGNYFFHQKSFMEYFTSKKMKKEIINGHLEIFSRKFLPIEIRKFLAMQLNSRDMEKLFEFISKTKNNLLRQNVINILIDTTQFEIILQYVNKIIKRNTENDRLNTSILYYYLSKIIPQKLSLQNVIKLLKDDLYDVRLFSSFTAGNIYSDWPKKYETEKIRMNHIPIKIDLIGYEEVGKTSILRKFKYNLFDNKYICTLGVKVTKGNLNIIRSIEKNQYELLNISLLIWDHMRWDVTWREITNEGIHFTYLKKTDGIIIVCDASKKEIFKNIKIILNEITSFVNKVPIIIALNKIDLLENHNIIKKVNKKINKEFPLLQCNLISTSGLTGENIEKLFIQMCYEILSNNHYKNQN
jgi:GTPase SAR1 family protein